MDEAARIRREAEEYAEAARRRADAFAEARVRRVRELTDRLIATAEAVDRRFTEAVAIKQQLDELVVALGAAAERATRELREPPARPEDPEAASRPIEVHVQDFRGPARGSSLS